MIQNFPEKQQAIVDQMSAGARLIYNKQQRQYRIETIDGKSNVTMDIISGLMSKNAIVVDSKLNDSEHLFRLTDEYAGNNNLEYTKSVVLLAMGFGKQLYYDKGTCKCYLRTAQHGEFDVRQAVIDSLLADGKIVVNNTSGNIVNYTATA